MISINPQPTPGFIQEPVSDLAFREAPTTFEDAISSISWLPEDISSTFACSSWDSKIHIYRILPLTTETSAVQDMSTLASMTIEYPCLSIAWERQTNCLVGGAIDGSIYMIDYVGNSVTTIGKHNDAVKGVYFTPSNGIVCSVSHDKTMKFWDRRIPSSIFNLNLGAKAVCSDMLDFNIAIGLSNEKLLILDTATLSVSGDISRYYIDSPLGNSSPLSAVSISKENVIGIGTSDGRSNLSNFERRDDGTTRLSNIVTFKAHKIDASNSDMKILFPIHAVGLHPLNKNRYLTAGGDGCIYFWDIPLRSKIANISNLCTPITAAKWSPNGKYLTYGIGYDWAKGIEGSKSIKNRLIIHTTQPAEA